MSEDCIESLNNERQSLLSGINISSRKKFTSPLPQSSGFSEDLPIQQTLG